MIRYLGERKQFGVPLATFQLNQEKLVRMLGNIQAMWLLGWRLCKLHGSGKMTTGQASLGKVNTQYVGGLALNSLSFRRHGLRSYRLMLHAGMDHEEGKGDGGALGRELLGGNGIVTDFHVGKAFCDMETLYTYEGSYDVNALIVAREISGISSIRPTSSRL